MGKQEDYKKKQEVIGAIKEAYNKKLEVIRAIEDSQIKKPHHIPVVTSSKRNPFISWHWMIRRR